MMRPIATSDALNAAEIAIIDALAVELAQADHEREKRQSGLAAHPCFRQDSVAPDRA